MSTEIYFQLLNPLVFLMFGAGLFCTHAVRPQKSAFTLSCSYFVGAIAFFTDIINERGFSFLEGIPTAALYAACAALVVGGLSQRYRGGAPWGFIATTTLLHVLLYSYLNIFVENKWLRSIEANVGCGVIFSIGVALIAGRQHRAIDRAIFWLMVLGAAQCFIRPALLVWANGGAVSMDTYSSSLFEVTMQIVVGICAIMTGMALLVAYSIEIIDDLHDRSERDPLSRLLNRRGFEDRAAALLRAADRNGAAVSIIIADIDRFKAINDTHGHDFGDMVIAEFGDLVRAFAADERIAGRIGGEEFALVLPGEIAADAIDIAEAMRREFESLEIETVEGAFAFSASFGVAARQPGEDIRYALARADEALYVAKSSGRNRVCGEADVGVEKLKAAHSKLERRRIRRGRAVDSAGEIAASG